MRFLDTLKAQFQNKLDNLKALSGTAYLRDIEAVHAKDRAAFATEAKSGTDPKRRICD